MKRYTKIEGHYDPSLFCEKCNKNTRHYKSGSEIRELEFYSPDPTRMGKFLPDPIPTAPTDNIEIIKYRCVECATERGWGGEEVGGVQ